MLDEFRVKFIKLKEKFSKKNRGDNLREMFEFADELERTQDKRVKRVLVDVYKILNFKQSAYELFKQIADMSSKKDLKELGCLKNLAASYGDKFAYERPRSQKEWDDEKADIPHFKYHPNPFKTRAFKRLETALICECCNKPTKINHTLGIYAIKNVSCLCPNCIRDGSAAKKFNGTFIQDAQDVSDPQKVKELFEQTPGYICWQGEYWLACCNDYCEFLGDVGTAELEDLGVADEVFAEYEAREDGYKDVRQYLTAGGPLAGYLFRCLHCGRYKIHVDAE
ncbi:CbrC family protein [Campylobacter sp.]|uniref:CbrC family protein n=1 Tax=Campylobacter sp. TaxID=205 RepID=UPI00270D0BEC|nr:CbrC family protein [Campylobacter sp.]